MLAALALAQAMPADEAGLRMQVDEAERQLRTSPFIVADPGLNAYVRGVACRLAGPDCAAIRVYLVRTPYMNASMAPNGAMIVWTGLLLRTRDEAELAAVLAHEIVHYRARHSLRAYRDYRRKADGWSLLGLPVGLATGGLGYSAIQLGLVASLSAFSREMEREADERSIELLRMAGYDTRSAAAIWSGVRAERLAAAGARGRRPRGEGGLFASHPTSEAREKTLRDLATEGGARHGDRFDVAMAPHWTWLIDDQVKLNDPGGTIWLLDRIEARDGRTPWIAYARAELSRAQGDVRSLNAAIALYRSAGSLIDAQRGLALSLARLDRADEASAAAVRYLTARPDAPDAAMLRMLVRP